MARNGVLKYNHKIEVVLTTDRPAKSNIMEQVYEKLGPLCTDVEIKMLNVVEHVEKEVTAVA